MSTASQVHTPAERRELLFRLSVSLKGLHAALEIIGAIALFLVGPDLLGRIKDLLGRAELAEQHHDLVAGTLRQMAAHLSVSGKQFAAWYLLSHGAVKLALVVALLCGMLWAYPVSIVVFTAFIVYQLYLFTLSHAIGLIVLTVFDLLVIWLIWLEYRAQRNPTPTLAR